MPLAGVWVGLRINEQAIERNNKALHKREHELRPRAMQELAMAKAKLEKLDREVDDIKKGLNDLAEQRVQLLRGEKFIERNGNI